MSGTKRLPWIRALQNDADMLLKSGALPPGFPSICDDADAWHQVMLNTSLWRDTVAKLHFINSARDPISSNSSVVCVGFSCASCHASFLSQRALGSHMRAKHGTRSPFLKFLISSTCQCCGTVFQQRHRHLQHLTDARNSICREWVAAHGSQFDAAGIAGLVSELRSARSEAWKAGLTGPVAITPAISSSGKIVGRVSS